VALKLTVHELQKAIWVFEKERRKENPFDYHCKEIKIHPETFRELMSDKEVQKYVELDPRMRHKFMGIPLIETLEFETYKIV
jgi:hypothetical protein